MAGASTTDNKYERAELIICPCRNPHLVRTRIEGKLLRGCYYEVCSLHFTNRQLLEVSSPFVNAPKQSKKGLTTKPRRNK